MEAYSRTRTEIKLAYENANQFENDAVRYDGCLIWTITDIVSFRTFRIFL